MEFYIKSYIKSYTELYTKLYIESMDIGHIGAES